MSHLANEALINDLQDFLLEHNSQEEYERIENMFWAAVDKEMREGE